MAAKYLRPHGWQVYGVTYEQDMPECNEGSGWIDRLQRDHRRREVDDERTIATGKPSPTLLPSALLVRELALARPTLHAQHCIPLRKAAAHGDCADVAARPSLSLIPV